MTAGVLTSVPARRGHFLLESGYHTDLWFTLDALFVDHDQIAPLVTALAERLRPYSVSAVCGPLLGGAFLAQALATTLRVGFYYTERVATPAGGALFSAEYRLAPELHRRVHGQRVAVVDDIIGAGSSVRATCSALSAAGASTVVVAALAVLGDTALKHFTALGVPVEMLAFHEFPLHKPTDCPLCQQGVPLESP
ncbi:MAG: phosphoribosyltransferase family protein [Longimicrobiales bacterium]